MIAATVVRLRVTRVCYVLRSFTHVTWLLIFVCYTRTRFAHHAFARRTIYVCVTVLFAVYRYVYVRVGYVYARLPFTAVPTHFTISVALRIDFHRTVSPFGYGSCTTLIAFAVQLPHAFALPTHTRVVTPRFAILPGCLRFTVCRLRCYR